MQKLATRDRLLQKYLAGFKEELQVRLIGPEIECIAVDRETLKPPTARQTVQFLENIARMRNGWQKNYGYLFIDGRWMVCCTSVSKKIGGYNACISTDVGTGQIEASVTPSPTLRKAEERLRETLSTVCDVAEKSGMYVLGLGIQPYASPEPKLVMPKGRYLTFLEIFGEHLGINSMNAAAQCHVEVTRGEAPTVSNALNGFSPALQALTANSAIVEGKMTEHVEFGRRGWDSLVKSGKIDARRVGIAERFDSVPVYFDRMLQFSPILTARRGEEFRFADPGLKEPMAKYLGQYVEVHNLKDGSATKIRITPTDMAFLEGTLWWEARLKSVFGTVELRCCPFQPNIDMIMAINSVALGLAANSTEAEEYLGAFTQKQLSEARLNVQKNGLDSKLGNTPITDVAAKMLEIARKGLIAIGEETSYLAPLEHNLSNKINPATRSIEVYLSLVRSSEEDISEEGMRKFIELHRFDPKLVAA